MKKKKQIQLLDVTLREGNYIIDFKLNTNHISQVVEYLEGAKVQHIEISNTCGTYPSGLTDDQYIEAAKTVAKNSKIGALLVPNANTSSLNLDKLCSQLDFIRVGINATQVENATAVVKELKRRKMPIFFQLMRTSDLSPSKAAIAAKKAEKMGADIVYIVDTMGSFTPPIVKKYVKAVRSKIDIPIGFHGHNHLGMALSNSLEAVRAGCDWVDASLIGVGRQGGNTQLEILALLLEREGYQTGLNIPLLLDVAESIAIPIFPNYKGIHPYDLWTAYYNIDLYPRWFYQKLAVLVGLDLKTFVQKLSQVNGISSLDLDTKLIHISKKFNIPIETLIQGIKGENSRFY